MGYSEVYCHICGVSFNIARLRRSDEPRSAAWCKMGVEYVPVGQDYNYGHQKTGCSETCLRVDRKRKDRELDLSRHRPIEDRVEDLTTDIDGNDSDSDYVDEESDRDEPLEYASDCSDSELILETIADSPREQWVDDFYRATYDPKPYEGYVRFRNGDDPHYMSEQPWYRKLQIGPLPGAKDEIFEPHDFDMKFNSKQNPDVRNTTGGQAPGRGDAALPEATSATSEVEVVPWVEPEGVPTSPPCEENEHIAGPECVNTVGYSGYRISVEEMRGCTTVQCLVRKDVQNPQWDHMALLPWTPQYDDEDFEVDGDIYLSGLSDTVPHTDIGGPIMAPARRGITAGYECVDAMNFMWDEDHAEGYCMPFHPCCLEVYKRVSMLRRGKEDIPGLFGWWELEADYKPFFEFPRGPDVERCREQDWQHISGTEYLVSNPLFIADLPSILRSAISTNPNFDTRNGAFDEIPTSAQGISPSDPFGLLPMELKLSVLADLPAKDIAALRLASCAFRQLPIRLWHTLLLRDKPWLWELWSTTPYSIWATKTGEECKVDDLIAEPACVDAYIAIAASEIPELRDVLQIKKKPYLEGYYAQVLEARAARTRALTLPERQTNWYVLYTALTRAGNALKGLRNRARIWEGCEEIVRRVQGYRESGEIPVQDLRAVVLGHRERERREREARDAERDAERAADKAAKKVATGEGSG